MTNSQAIEVAVEWRAVAGWCKELIADLDSIAHATVATIRQQFVEYNRLVTLDEHVRSVRRQHRDRLTALSERRSLHDAELERVDQLARTRAFEGISVDTLIGAHHVGDQELWRRLRQLAGTDTGALPDVATLMMESLHLMTTVLASAHAEVAGIDQSHRASLAQRLIELLWSGRPSAEVTALLDALGIGADQSLVAVVTNEATVDRHADLVNHDRVIAGTVAGHHAALIAAGSADDATSLIPWVGARVGVSRPHEAHKGAMTSLHEAQLALVATSADRRIAFIETDWLVATILQNWPLLGPDMEHAAQTAARHPHLTQAVTALYETGTVRKAAGQLYVHPNTVTYRLERWRDVTTFSTRSPDGLIRSVAACHRAEQLDYDGDAIPAMKI